MVEIVEAERVFNRDGAKGRVEYQGGGALCSRFLPTQ